MAAWISVAIGLIVALVMITASLWWSLRPRFKDSRSMLPEAHESRKKPKDTVVPRLGNDDP